MSSQEYNMCMCVFFPYILQDINILQFSIVNLTFTAQIQLFVCQY